MEKTMNRGGPALLSPFVWHEVPHTILASVVSTTFAVAGIHAFQLMKKRRPEFHRKALEIALLVGVPAALA
jgi:cytochrome d ubiquinol oxidase subunit I